jgi:hypothetical protein
MKMKEAWFNHFMMDYNLCSNTFLFVKPLALSSPHATCLSHGFLMPLSHPEMICLSAGVATPS